MADRIVVMDQGRIQQIGAPLQLYNRPANKFVASFIGSPSMNILPGIVTDIAKNSLTLHLGTSHFTLQPRGPATLQNGEPIELGIRPEHAHLVDPSSPDAVLPGKIRLVERLGNQTLVHLETPCGGFILQGGGELEGKTGDLTALAFDASRAHGFDAEGRVI